MAHWTSAVPLQGVLASWGHASLAPEMSCGVPMLGQDVQSKPREQSTHRPVELEPYCNLKPDTCVTGVSINAN